MLKFPSFFWPDEHIDCMIWKWGLATIESQIRGLWVVSGSQSILSRWLHWKFVHMINWQDRYFIVTVNFIVYYTPNEPKDYTRIFPSLSRCLPLSLRCDFASISYSHLNPLSWASSLSLCGPDRWPDGSRIHGDSTRLGANPGQEIATSFSNSDESQLIIKFDPYRPRCWIFFSTFHF